MLRALTGGIPLPWIAAGIFAMGAVALGWLLLSAHETIGEQAIALDVAAQRVQQLEEDAKAQAERVQALTDDLAAAEAARAAAERDAADDRRRVSRARASGGDAAAAKTAADIFNGRAVEAEE